MVSKLPIQGVGAWAGSGQSSHLRLHLDGPPLRFLQNDLRNRQVSAISRCVLKSGARAKRQVCLDTIPPQTHINVLIVQLSIIVSFAKDRVRPAANGIEELGFLRAALVLMVHNTMHD